jgi:hypothetical protein
MAGLSDYATLASANYWTGGLVMPALPAGEWLGLCTTAPTSDTGSLGTNGATEVSGGSYARAQVSGTVTTNAVSTSSATLNFASVPAWLTTVTNGVAAAVGMYVRSITTPANIPANTTVVSVTGTTVVISTTVTVSSSEAIRFSAYAQAVASSGTEPVTTPASIANTNCVIPFPQATASWGTANSWFLADSASGNTNIIWWDYLGNYKWLPFTGTLASPSVLTVPAHGFANGDSVVVTQKFGGVLPQAGSFAGVLTVAGQTTDTFNVGVNAATASGGGSIRKVIPQPIAINVTASFAATAMTLTLA